MRRAECLWTRVRLHMFVLFTNEGHRVTQQHLFILALSFFAHHDYSCSFLTCAGWAVCGHGKPIVAVTEENDNGSAQAAATLQTESSSLLKSDHGCAADGMQAKLCLH